MVVVVVGTPWWHWGHPGSVRDVVVGEPLGGVGDIPVVLGTPRWCRAHGGGVGDTAVAVTGPPVVASPSPAAGAHLGH